MGTMVIRVWHETAHADAFRARLTMSDEEGAENSIVSGNRDEVLAAVRAWLADQSPAGASDPVY
jgi:hypothetical protein